MLKHPSACLLADMHAMMRDYSVAPQLSYFGPVRAVCPHLSPPYEPPTLGTLWASAAAIERHNREDDRQAALMRRRDLAEWVQP